MAEITGNSLIQDWYDRYVKPLKQPISLSSSAPQDFNVGLPPSSMPSSPSPQAPVNPPMEAPSAAPTPTTPTEGGSSWSDNLNKGMQDPAKVGLLGAGLSMMATPPRNVPYSAGEIIGNAGLHGLSFFQKAVDDKRRSEAMAMQQEDRALSREDQRFYREGLLEDRASQREIQRQNAESLSGMREATAAARTGKLVPVKQADGSIAYERMLDAVGQEVPQKPTPSAWRQVNFNGKNQWVDLNSPEARDLVKQGAFGVVDKPGYKYFVADDGSVREIQTGAAPGTPPKVVAPPGTGKKTRPPAGAKGGSEKLFQYQDRKATESLKQKGVATPTVEQIAAERQVLFPKGTPKAAINDPLSSLLGPAKTGNEYLKQATTRDQAKERIRKMSEAGYTRQQIEEALKGTQWQ